MLGWASVWRAAGVTTNPAICPAIETQQPADIMEAESVRQLRKHHRRQMAPDGVTPGRGIHPMLPRGGLDDPLRNKLEKLSPPH